MTESAHTFNSTDTAKMLDMYLAFCEARSANQPTAAAYADYSKFAKVVAGEAASAAHGPFYKPADQAAAEKALQGVFAAAVAADPRFDAYR